MKRTTASGLLLALFTILVSLWIMLGHGPWADDLPYSHLPVGSEDDFFSCTGPHLTSLSQLPQAWWHHYLTVNGRLANMAAFLLPLCPALVILLCIAAFPAMIAALCRLTRGCEWTRSPLTVICIVLLTWLILPWGEQMISLDYYLNYAAAAALNQWVLVFAIGDATPSTRKKSVLLLAAVAALMHEGMALAVDAALICLMLQHRRFDLMSTVYLCFSLMPVLSPGIFGHASNVSQLEYGYNFYYYTIGLQLWPLWAAVIFSILSAIRRRRIDALTLSFWAITVVTVVLAIFARQGGRVFWLPLCLSIVILLRPVHLRLSRGLYRAMFTILTCLFTAFMSYLIAWQFYAAQEARSILKELAGGNRVIYRDVIEPDDVPLILTPYLNYVNGAATIRANLSAEAFHDWREPFIVLPRKYLTPEKLPLIPGTAGAQGSGEVFLARRGLFEACYTHSLQGANLLTTLRFRGAGEVPQKVTLYEVPLSDTLSAYRPLIRAKSLIGTPVLRIDAMKSRKEVP